MPVNIVGRVLRDGLSYLWMSYHSASDASVPSLAHSGGVRNLMPGPNCPSAGWPMAELCLFWCAFAAQYPRTGRPLARVCPRMWAALPLPDYRYDCAWCPFFFGSVALHKRRLNRFKRVLCVFKS